MIYVDEIRACRVTWRCVAGKRMICGGFHAVVDA